MAKFKIELPDTGILPDGIDEWDKIKFHSLSLWGTGNKGQNLWGFPEEEGTRASVTVSDIKEDNNNWYLEVEAENPSPNGPHETYAFITRYKVPDRSFVGVHATNKISRV